MVRAELPAGVRISYRRQYRRCGKAGCARCAAGGPGHGPYWYATWRAEGRRHSQYLGKQAPPAAVGAVGAPGGPSVEPAPRMSQVALRVRTLGGFAVWRGDTPLAAERWAGRRATALFQCLLSAPGHRLRREQAADWLWPEADPVAAATNLRTTLHLLRAVLDDPSNGVSYLRARGPLIELAPGGGAAPATDWLDAEAFARAARAALDGRDAAACRTALAFYGGEYLPDDPYAPWAEPPRATLRRQRLELLRHLADLSGAQGDLEESERCLRRLLTAEPTDEDAAAALMGLLAASGRRAEALRAYQALATALEEELDAAPSAEVAALRARLLAQEAAPRAAALSPAPTPPRPTNLPAALSSFVGRTWELAELAGLLAGSRLVTLTGPGGCGKTRLALEVAARLVDSHAQGVWLVELAGLAAPALVPSAVAAALGVAEQPGQPLSRTLAVFLRTRQLLLVLDNCEHLLGACAALAAELLAACPHLRMLATSREALGTAGERTYRVPSLAAPDPDRLLPPAQLAAYEAVQLFLARAQARDLALRLTEGNVGAIAAICARLDGLPLAIELAAARTNVLPVEGIAARLDDRFGLLTGGPRTALPRQRTLRATIDWSYGLLDEPERALLRRLAVFAGGWTLEAAEAVCVGEGVAAAAMLDLLGALVDKSLVVVERRDAEARYRLLDTLRQYAWEKLEAAGEAERVRQRHGLYYLGVAEQAQHGFMGSDQALWFARVSREFENLWVAAHGLIAQGEAEHAERLTTALGPFWTVRGRRREGRELLSVVLAALGETQSIARANVLYSAAMLALWDGELAVARSLLQEALALARDLGDQEDVGQILTGLGYVATLQGDRATARQLLEKSVAALQEAGGEWTRAWAFTLLGEACLAQGDIARGRMLCQDAVALRRRMGDRQGLAIALGILASAVRIQGDPAGARALLEEALTLQRMLGDTMNTPVSLYRLATLVWQQGAEAEAHAYYADGLRSWSETASRRPAMALLAGLAALVAATAPAHALRLAAAAEAAGRNGDLPLPMVLNYYYPAVKPDRLARRLEMARRAVGAEVAATAWAEGQAMTLERAIAYALEDEPAASPSP